MAFLNKVANILRHTATKQFNADLSVSRPSIYHAARYMSSKLFIGGISYSTDDHSLREAFAKYGDVTEARVIMDRDTGRSRGFGFVTFNSNEEASSAIQALDGQDLHGRQVRVNFAAERARPSYGGGGGYNGGGNYGGGSYGDGGYSGGGSYGGGGNYGGGSYGGSGSGSDGFQSGGNYGVSYGTSGNAGGGSDYGGNYGGAPGTVGNVDNSYASGGTGGGFDGSAAAFGGGGEFGNESNSINNSATGDKNFGEPSEGNYSDDLDDTSDFAKRA